MSGNWKLTSLLTQPNLKKINKYGRSRRLDVEELVAIALKYSVMVAELGPDLNPLHVACVRSRPDIVSALIQDGYDVNVETGTVGSYLQIALESGNISVANLLLELGADAQAMNKNGQTPMGAVLSTITKEKTCIGAARLLIEAGVPVDAIACREAQEKPLHLAVIHNLPSVVSFLLQKGADGNVLDKHGSTPLHYACYRDMVGIIKLLILHEVNLYIENKLNSTPLFIVVTGFFKEALSALINGGCDINKLMFNGTSSALHLAVQECNLEKVMFLVSLGADPNLQLSCGATPLHALTGRLRVENVAEEKTKAQNSLDILEFLVEKGANVNGVNSIIFPPLLAAVMNKHFQLAKQFIRLGADISFQSCSSGRTIFHEVADVNHDISTLLIEYGADYNKRTDEGFTPYHRAIMGKVNQKFIKSFVHYGCPYDQDFGAWNKLEMDFSQEFKQFLKAEEQFFKGVRENNFKLVQKAVEYGAVPTGCSEAFRYPLHFVATKGYKEILKYLLENGFPVNTVNDEGETALFIAAKQGHYDICCTLLQFGASFNCYSKQCPMMVPDQFDNKSIVDMSKSLVTIFHSASKGERYVIKFLREALSRSYNEYLMYVNATNCKGDTLMSTSLRFNYIENAREMMKLRIFASLN